MYVERKVCYSALFTNLVGWHAGAVGFPPEWHHFGPSSLPPEWRHVLFTFCKNKSISLQTLDIIVSMHLAILSNLWIKQYLVKFLDDVRGDRVLVLELFDDGVRVQDPALRHVRQSHPVAVQAAQPRSTAGLIVRAGLMGHLVKQEGVSTIDI